jgi:micrococcal nuclease
VIRQLRQALAVSLVAAAGLAISPAPMASAQPVLGQEGVTAGLRVVLGTEPRTGQRYIQLTGQNAPTYPTVDIACDGKRWTLPLTRFEDGSVYALSRSIAEAMLAGLNCRVFLPDQEVALTRQQVWAAWANPARGLEPPYVLVGQVIEVLDGNTIRVNLGDRAETVRYIGINAKATTLPTNPPTPIEAAEANRQLVARQQVRLELDTQERDREGRLLAYVYVADKMVNAELLRRGSAEIMTIQPNVRHRDLFVTVEQEARDDKRGLWADQSEPTTPTSLAQAARPSGAERPGVSPESTGACPTAQPIKGKLTAYSSGRCIFHVPDSELYGPTKAERCYATVDDARRDGCQAARR